MRIGIDLGGTKIEGLVLDAGGVEKARLRVPTPGSSYEDTLNGVLDVVAELERRAGERCTVGIAHPGAVSPATGLIKNANSTRLNGKPVKVDLEHALGREVRMQNDANCFALSEAIDGAGAGHGVVFGVILGTGCGGGVVIDGKVLRGRNHVTGEWGHNPLPWPRLEEVPGPRCWCGHAGCLETWIAGPSLARDCDGEGAHDASGIPARAASGEARAKAALERHADRLARGLAHVVNLLDPDVIVLGGGLSNMQHLYSALPPLVTSYVFSDFVRTPIVANQHGDSSGVRGAAWLWPTP